MLLMRASGFHAALQAALANKNFMPKGEPPLVLLLTGLVYWYCCCTAAVLALADKNFMPIAEPPLVLLLYCCCPAAGAVGHSWCWHWA
jgi:hypothetical protein